MARLKYSRTGKTPARDRCYLGTQKHFFKAKIHLILLVQWQQRFILLIHRAECNKRCNNAGFFFRYKISLAFYNRPSIGKFLKIWKHPISSGSLKYQWMAGPTFIHRIKCLLFVKTENYSLACYEPEHFRKF